MRVPCQLGVSRGGYSDILYHFRSVFIWQTSYLSVEVSSMVHVDMMTSSNRKRIPRCWPFVRGIHRPPVNSPHKSQWRGAMMFSLICTCIYGWVNNGEAGDLRRHHACYDVTVMETRFHVIRPRHGVPFLKCVKAKAVTKPSVCRMSLLIVEWIVIYAHEIVWNRSGASFCIWIYYLPRKPQR